MNTGSQSQSFNQKKDGLTKCNIATYGTGHVFNDLAAACWFNYLIYYLKIVIQLSSAGAAAVHLSGQIIDGVSTPLVGILSDKSDSRIGKRKPYYIFGTIVVTFAFGFIWQKCPFDDEATEIFWYCLFASLFNNGWACVQIAHMSMIPQLSYDKDRKNMLIGLRTAFIYLSNLFVLVVAFGLFAGMSDPTVQFSILSAIVIVIGLIFNISFIFALPEKKLSDEVEESNRAARYQLIIPTEGQRGALSRSLSVSPAFNSATSENISWRQWLSQLKLYPVAGTYMLSRLACNSNMSLLPFYLTIVLHAGGLSSPDELANETPWQLAVIPLIMYIGSSGISLIMGRVGSRIDRKMQQLIGCVLINTCSIPMFFLGPDLIDFMYPLAFFLGVGFSMQLNNSVGLVSEFVGTNGKSGAFVWGFNSLLDKLGTGFIMFVVLTFGDMDSSDYLSYVVPGIPLLSSVLAFAFCIFTKSNDTPKENTSPLKNRKMNVAMTPKERFLYNQVSQMIKEHGRIKMQLNNTF